MHKRRQSSASSRRNFLKGAGLVGAAAAVAPQVTANAAPVAPQPQLKAAVPGPLQTAAETLAPSSDPVNQTSSGGDFMTDVLNSLGIEYLAINCASSYRGLHEAVLNHANNKPEIITCVHEDIAVHMAQGYAKIEGKPMAMACHGVVGLQHATMAMYNAWCDRVPVLVFGGNIMEADKRGPGAEWLHAGVDIGQIVREFTKWDDQPVSLTHFAEFTVRAYKIATTPPMGPVFIALDAELQENPIPDPENLRIPKFAPVIPPQGDAGAIADAAKMLVEAQNPVIICDRVARTPAGMANLVALAEALQCGVIDNAGRMNFPSRHPLNQSFRRAHDRSGRRDPGDGDERSVGHARPISATASCGARHRGIKSGAKLITLGTRDLYLKSNYQDFGRWQDIDLDIAGDAEASLPVLTEAVKRLTDDGRKAAFDARGKKLAATHLAMVEQSKTDATSAGMQARSPRRACARKSTPRSKTRIGQWSVPRSSCPGRIGCGISTSRTSGTASPAAPASATISRRRSVRRWPTRSMAASRWRSAATATSCSIRARCGRPRITTFRSSTSSRTTAPIIRNTCTSSRWPRDMAATSQDGYRHDAQRPEYRLRHRRPRHGRPRRGPITDPKDLAPALTRAIAAVKSGQPAVVDVVTDPR